MQTRSHHQQNESAIDEEVAVQFASRLIAWQKLAGRHDLPWQDSSGAVDPYRVWVSEIMLQQTQVATVIPYYQRFMERFATLEALAAASLDQVLAHWSGLGYYTRARNLHRCAQVLQLDYAACFPKTPDQLQQLPGIGRSTAAAIAVFAFGARAAILDGNVRRVLVRIFGAREKQGLWALAERLLPRTDLTAYTQGLMDLGATICRPKKPRCSDCPLKTDCVAHRSGQQDELPHAPVRPRRSTRRLWLLVVHNEVSVLLEKRKAQGIWGGLWSFPEFANEQQAAEFAYTLDPAIQLLAAEPIRHELTHLRLLLHPLLGRSQAVQHLADLSIAGCRWVPHTEWAHYGLPAPILALMQTLLGVIQADGARAIVPPTPTRR